MELPSSRTLQILGIVTAVLLVALLFYPGTFSPPYTEIHADQYSHTLVSEPEGEGELPVYEYDELSPVAQEMFDRTRNAEGSYTPNVCQEFMLVCDEYREDELPDEFTYGSYLSPSEAHVIVEDGNESYVLKTGGNNQADWFLSPGGLLSFVTLIPSAIFIVFVVGAARIHGTATADRVLGATTAGGATVGVLAVLAPYLEMFGLITAETLGQLLVYALFAGFVEIRYLRQIITGLV